MARVHPGETVLRNIFSSLVVGVVQGVLLYGLIGRIDLVAIGGANVIHVLFNTAVSNLRHNHIRLSYGRVIEHILISPAQHQIHHSAAARHFNKNCGSIFAFWDWAFGALYIPDSHEGLPARALGVWDWRQISRGPPSIPPSPGASRPALPP